MSWYYKNIKLAASPKNIVNNWKVDDPFLKFFIYTYEPLIDLNKVKSQEDLKSYLQTTLIPSLKEKITQGSHDNYYKKSITDEEALAEVEEHPHDIRLQNAIRVFKADPEAAKKVLLNAINEDKQTSFDKWWNYMEEGYGDNPAFFYSVLNPMIESSPPSQKNGPPPAHREAVAAIHDEIGTKGVNQMNVFKKFNKISFKLDKETSESIDVDNNKCWVRIDSKGRDGQNYKSNQEKLMRFATGSGWCIAQDSHSSRYLSQGDFWLYFENKRPKAAIRLLGDKKVAEIRGTYNKEVTLNPLWEPITTFLHNTDFNYTSNGAYKRLQDIMYKNVDLENNPEAYQSLLNAIKNDPKQFGLVSDENKRKFPELTQAAGIGYEKRMNVLLDAVEKIPPYGNEYQVRFSQFQDEFNDIPAEVKPYLSGDIEGRLVSVHKNAFLRNPLEYEHFPEDMKAQITPQEKRMAWSFYVGNDPYRYNDLRIPQEIRKDIPIEPIVESWKHLVNVNISHADNIPSYILRFLPPNYVENKIVEDFKRYPCNRDKKGFDKLRRVREKGLMAEEQIAQTYLDVVTRRPNIFKYIPPQYKEFVKNNLGDMGPVAERHLNEVMFDATYFNSIADPQIKNWLLQNKKQELIKSFLQLAGKYGGDLIGFWKKVPIELQQDMPEYMKEGVADLYLPYVRNNPDFLNKISPVLHQYITNKLASTKNWYRKLVVA